MNLIEAINEMKNGKVVKGSNLLLYRIKDVTIEYFHKPHWLKTGLSVLELSELTFELTESPNETLSDKIQVGGVGHKLYFEEDVEEFIKQLKNNCNNLMQHEIPLESARVHTYVSSISKKEVFDTIDKLAGDRFK